MTANQPAPQKSSEGEMQLWYMTTQIDDYFRRLGGAGCYEHFRDWHVPALVLVAIKWRDLKATQYARAVKELIDPAMWLRTDGLVLKARNLTMGIEFTRADLSAYLDYIERRCPFGRDRIYHAGWERFLEQQNLLRQNHEAAIHIGSDTTGHH